MTNFLEIEKNKVIVIGLDGATLDVIAPLIKKGKLPNIERIMRNGVYGNLKSTIHPITPQAWTSFLTGKNAGKHGILDFTMRRRNSYQIQFINASMRKAESIFSLLSKDQKWMGAVAIPFTFPPEKVNGFMLSGIDSPAEDSRAFHPESLYSEIKGKFGNYYIHLASPVGRKKDQEKFWKDIQTEDENRTQISKYLLKKYPCDLFVVVYNNIDRVQHQHLGESFYHRLQTNYDIPDDDLLIRTYQNADAQIGILLSDLEDEATVVIMSDHGSGPIRKVFFLNRWFERNGLLKYQEKKKDRFLNSLQQVRFLAKRFLPRKAKNFIKSNLTVFRDKVDSVLSFSEIDWRQTKAYGFGIYGNIYINLRGREPEGIVEPGNEFEKVCNQIIESLDKLKDPDTGDKIINKIYRREELYQGPYLSDMPDLIIGWKDYSYYTSVTLGRERGPIFGPPMKIDCSEYDHIGTHRLNGIFMVMGNAIRQRQKITGADIYDLAPTILYILGQPIPDDMDGKVIPEIFEPEFLKKNPPKYHHAKYETNETETVSYTDEESQKVAERLKALGYIE